MRFQACRFRAPPFLAKSKIWLIFTADFFCLEGAIIVLACIIFSVIAKANPGFDDELSAAAMVWSYIGQVVGGMLILVGTIKMSDRIVKEMMGL